MRVSLNWLADYIDLPTTDPDELDRTLQMLGHEVEGVERVEPGWKGVLTARVETVGPHPDADKVRVCTVTTGGDPVTVVCGAWNFEAGAMVAYAVPGAVLGGDVEIGVRTIRGVESHGMICSERELGLGDDAGGIMVLAPDTETGRPLESLLKLPDVVFDLSITPNRPDAMSMVGIARDLGAWYQVPVRPPNPPGPPPDVGEAIHLSIEDPERNPRFAATRVDGVEVAPSPLWMQTRLLRAGIRPISNLVDVTNYVMMELGQPLHVFDVDLISGGRLVVRRAHEGETLVTLDGVDRRLDPDDVVISDETGPTSLAGIMGGERSEVSSSTKSTVIEAATWSPPFVLTASRRHGLRSEASARFERGVDPDLPPRATARAAELIVATAGGVVAGVTDVVARSIEPVTLQLSLHDATRLLGPGFDAPRVSGLLERLGFGVSGSDPLTVSVPSYRPDVTRPVDLVEEVARLADLDTFDERLRIGSGGGLTRRQVAERRLIHVLTGLGYNQAVSLPFVMPSEATWLTATDGGEPVGTVEVKNPLSETEAVLRPSLLPGLLRAVRHNRNRGRRDVAFFEIGRVFHARPSPDDDRIPDQPTRLGLLLAGPAGPVGLDGNGQASDATAMLALVRHLASVMGLTLTVEQSETPGFHPTRTARVLADGHPAGVVGELHPRLVSSFELEGRMAAAELDLDTILATHLDAVYRPVSPYPPADFDLSFEVADVTPAGAIVAVLERAGGDLVEFVRPFDRFTGGNLAEGSKALAFRVRIRANDRTLGAEEIGRLRTSMVESASGVGAVLRGET